MKNNEYVNILKIKDFKIKIKKLLNQLNIDELLYIHMHLTTKSEFQEMFSNLEYPLDYNDFELAKNRFKIKKVRKENIIENIMDILVVTYNKENIDWLDMSIFYDECSTNDDFYRVLYKLFCHRVLSDFRIINREDIAKYTISLSDDTMSKKAEYNCIKTICALHMAEDYFKIQDEVLGEEKPKRAKKKLQVEINALEQQLAFCVHSNYTLVCKDNINDIENQVVILKNDVKKGNLRIDDKNNKIKELKENLRVVTKQLKDFQKITQLTTLEKDIKSIYLKLDLLEKSNESISKELKTSKEDILRKSYEKQIDNYATKLVDLKRDLNLKSIECKDLRKTINDFEENIENRFILYVEKNGLSESMIKFLTPLMDEERNLMKEYLDNNLQLSSKEENDSELITISKSQFKSVKKLGYIEIEDDIHYVVFNNGSKFKLDNLSDRIYFVDGQFVVVDEDNNFIKTTLSIYEDNGISIRSLKLGTIESTEPLVVRVGDELIEARNTSNFNGYYNLNQVVGLNEFNQIVRAFRLVKFNADTVLASVKARDIKMYYVLNVYEDCLSVRNIETGEESLTKFDIGDFNILKTHVVFVKNNKVINTLTKGYFYTCSSLYSGNVEFGPVSVIGDVIVLKKQSGKSVVVENVPENVNIEDGQVVYIDEFNNYMYTSSTDKVFIEKTIARKTAKQIVSGFDYKKPIEEKGKITLIGNPYYKNSYIMAFYKNGYKVSVLHGYDSNLNKIVQESKDSLAIIVNTSYCSHDNFWQIKDEVKKGQLEGKKCLFTQEDGANMLVNKLNELLESKEISITN